MVVHSFGHSLQDRALSKLPKRAFLIGGQDHACHLLHVLQVRHDSIFPDETAACRSRYRAAHVFIFPPPIDAAAGYTSPDGGIGACDLCLPSKVVCHRQVSWR